MNPFDYYTNPEIIKYIKKELKYIANIEDKEDCRQDIFSDLYAFMPLDIYQSKKVIKNVCEKFKRRKNKIFDNEMSYKEAGLV